MRKPFLWQARKAWYVRVPDGDKLRLVKLGESRREAYDRWREMHRQAEVSAGWGRRSVADLVDLYAADLQARLSRGELSRLTVTLRLTRLSSFSAHIGTDLATDDLTETRIIEWLDSEAGWGLTSRSEAARAVRAAMRWAVRRRYLESNPIESLRLPKGGRREYLIDQETYQRMLGGWKFMRKDSEAFRQVLIALHGTGCRPGEIIAVNVEDVANDGTTWVLPRHKNVKKTGQPRIVYLSPEMQQMTRELIDGRKKGPLFLMGNGDRWEYPIMRRAFHRLRERAKIDKDCVLYAFRHTWITSALMAGVDLATVATMAGTSIQMIDRHYGHLARHHDHLIQSAAAVQAKLAAG